MTAFGAWFRAKAGEVVDDFYGQLAQLPRSHRVLEMLTTDEMLRLKRGMAGHLSDLAGDGMTREQLEATARHIGWIHSVTGIDRDELVGGHDLIKATLNQHMLRHGGFRDQAAFPFIRRLAQDLAWQLQEYQGIEGVRQDILQRVTQVAWRAQSYTDLISSTVETLMAHKGIASCAIGRPDADGLFHFEAVSPSGTADYFAEAHESPTARMMVQADRPGGQGPVGRAWREGQVERIINFAKEQQAAPWRALALGRGLRSCIAVPLGTGPRPLAVLLVHSRYPGGFIGLQQQAFFEMLRTLLGSAFARLDETDALHAAIPFAARNHFAALVRTGALRMHYQPILDLRTWKVSKVEALVRLQDGERLLGPGQFLDALNGDDLLEVFGRGLNQALADRNEWLAAGIDLSISINLPPAALGDIRFYEVTRAALEAHHCPASSLTLEVLENQAASLSHGRQALLDRFRSLGVLLAQDDLGSGQSGLNRLRELPFDLIKIDRGMVTVGDADPTPALRLVHQLTRLGHALGKRVLVEGVETEDWLVALALLGVDSVQGYVVSRPMPASALMAWSQERAPERRLEQFENSAPVRLARLLVWSERLSLNEGLVQQLSARPETAAAGQALCDALTAFPDPPPRTPEEAEAQQALIEAVHASGPEGEAFGRAYRRLSALILKG